jgi:flagellar hook-length control protein FliK
MDTRAPTSPTATDHARATTRGAARDKHARDDARNRVEDDARAERPERDRASDKKGVRSEQSFEKHLERGTATRKAANQVASAEPQVAGEATDTASVELETAAPEVTRIALAALEGARDESASPPSGAHAPLALPTLPLPPVSIETLPGQPPIAIGELAEPRPSVEFSTQAIATPEIAEHDRSAARHVAEPRAPENPVARADAEIDAPRASSARDAALHDTGRAAEILRQVRVNLAPDMRHAVIQLHPAELGRISIRLEVERGRMNAIVHAEKREALAAIERHLPELSAALRDQGIETRGFQLSLGFGEHRGGESNPAPAPREHVSAIETNPPAALVRALDALGGIDTYA